MTFKVNKQFNLDLKEAIMTRFGSGESFTPADFAEIGRIHDRDETGIKYALRNLESIQGIKRVCKDRHVYALIEGVNLLPKMSEKKAMWRAKIKAEEDNISRIGNSLHHVLNGIVFNRIYGGGA